MDLEAEFRAVVAVEDEEGPLATARWMGLDSVNVDGVMGRFSTHRRFCVLDDDAVVENASYDLRSSVAGEGERCPLGNDVDPSMTVERLARD